MRRNDKANLVGSFQIDYQLELGRLLYWQIAGFCAFEYSIDKVRNPPIASLEIGSIVNQPTVIDVLFSTLYRRQPAARCESHNTFAIGVHERSRRDV